MIAYRLIIFAFSVNSFLTHGQELSLPFSMTSQSQCAGPVLVQTYAECSRSKTEILYTTKPQWTGWVGGGFNQDWGCEQIQGRFTDQILKASRGGSFIRWLKKDERSRRVDFGTRVEYQYQCEVQVARERVVIGKDVSCGASESLEIVGLISDVQTLKSLQESHTAVFAAFCLDCSDISDRATVQEMSNCVLSRLEAFGLIPSKEIGESLLDVELLEARDREFLFQMASELMELKELLPFSQAQKLKSYLDAEESAR